MLKSIYMFLRYFPFYLKLYLDFRRVRKYTQELLISVKSKFENWEELVDTANEKRMMDYIFVQTMWASGFCLLRGDRMKDNELKAIINISALAPLYDDFFDKVVLSSEKIHFLVNTPFDYNAETDIEKLFIEFSQNIHKNVKNIPFYLENALRVFKAQYESKRLVSDKEITRNEVELIAFEKGASTVVCMCNMLNKPLTIEEESVMNQLGAVAQFLDDIFDLWEDFDEGRQTLSNPSSDIDHLEELFLKEVSSLKKYLFKSGFKTGNINAFYFPVSYMVGATRVCLGIYKKLQLKTNNIFMVEKYSRKDMVCDMEDPLVRLKALRLSEF